MLGEMVWKNTHVVGYMILFYFTNYYTLACIILLLYYIDYYINMLVHLQIAQEMHRHGHLYAHPHIHTPLSVLFPQGKVKGGSDGMENITGYHIII